MPDEETEKVTEIGRPRGRPKKIEIPDLSKVDIKVEKLPSAEEEKKAKKGRPPKAKPVSWKEIKDSDVGKSLDGTITDILNRTVLKNGEKLEEKDCKVGSAVLYTISYYAPNVPVDHPIMILLSSCVGLGFTIMRKKAKKIVKQEGEKNEL